ELLELRFLLAGVHHRAGSEAQAVRGAGGIDIGERRLRLQAVRREFSQVGDEALWLGISGIAGGSSDLHQRAVQTLRMEAKALAAGAQQWGAGADVAVSDRRSGQGLADAGVFRPGSGTLVAVDDQFIPLRGG